MPRNHGSGGTILPERHAFILEILRQQGSVSVSTLAERLKVSEVTIRKDLTTLENQKMLYRTHGNAILINPYINDRHINEKETQNVEEKRAISRRAAETIDTDDSILIASGTTVSFFAREIVARKHLTAITASLHVASILSRHNNIDVIQLGGQVRNSSVSVIGTYAERMLTDFSCSKLFLGADGIDPAYGLTTTNLMEANLNRIMIASAQKTIVLADSTKFGRRGFSKICNLDQIDQIITDDKIAPHTLALLQERGIEVTVTKS